MLGFAGTDGPDGSSGPAGPVGRALKKASYINAATVMDSMVGRR